MLCSWGGEEFGLLGSTEWVEVRFRSLIVLLRKLHDARFRSLIVLLRKLHDAFWLNDNPVYSRHFVVIKHKLTADLMQLIPGQHPHVVPESHRVPQRGFTNQR